ncbi:MAG: hypothetical protein NVS3B10_10820 [Polyangiales bacterium]
MVADDALREVIADLLAEQGYNASGARSLGEARSRLQTRVPEVLVIDPGVHQAAELRVFILAQAAQRRLPATMVLTDRGSVLDVAAELEVVCVSEPFDLDDFVAQLRQLDVPVAARRIAPGR